MKYLHKMLSLYNLSVVVRGARNSKLRVKFVYDNSQFKDETIVNLLQQYHQLLKLIAISPDATIAQIQTQISA